MFVGRRRCLEHVLVRKGGWRGCKVIVKNVHDRRCGLGASSWMILMVSVSMFVPGIELWRENESGVV